jgi:monofunctional biosynthetic peptidoglycan transglycosylase
MKTLKLSIKIIVFFVLVFSVAGLWLFSKIPSDKTIRGCLTTEMYKVDLCPGSAKYISLRNVSPYLQRAIVLTEDGSFWQHNGFDLQELQISLKTNLEKGRFARGGSTITQQLSKNMFLTKEKTIFRKIVEAIITVRIEKVLSKKEILERYLNVVQFGKNVFGIKQASQYYFKKEPRELSLTESAFLAFLLPGPEVYSKSFYKKKLTPFAENRLNQILDRLYQYNSVDESEYVTAKAELAYFLTGEEPPSIDPALDLLSEEEVKDDFE